MKEVATMELRYRGKNEQPPPALFGTYLGQGDGEIAGSLISGAVTWDLYENQSTTGREVNMLGTIRTDSERGIGFDILGFFTRMKARRFGGWPRQSGLTSRPRAAIRRSTGRGLSRARSIRNPIFKTIAYSCRRIDPNQRQPTTKSARC